MDRKAASRVRTIRLRNDQADRRCRQRLKADLGLDDEAVEVVMNLLNQVTALQARLRELETTLETYQAVSGSRLADYRQMYFEATWEEA